MMNKDENKDHTNENKSNNDENKNENTDKFRKYNSIDNLHAKGLVYQVKRHGYDAENIEWIGTEKVHGSNFAFIVHSDNKIECAKRSGILNDEESFHNHKNVLERVEKQLISLKDTIYEHMNEYKDQSITIFGE